MTLPILPTAPSRTDPTNFSVEADAWVAALGPWTDAANAMEASLQTSNLVGTSTTSLAVGTGSKGFTTQAGKAWIVGSYVFIVATSDRSRVMQGKVTAYNSGTGSLVVDVNISSGSGTYASWDIGIANPSIGATSGVNIAGSTLANWFGFNTSGTPSGLSTGIAAPASDTLGLYTNTVKRVEVDSSGNVGIGTSPGTKLDVAGNMALSGATTGIRYFSIVSTGGSAQFGLESSAGNSLLNGASAYSFSIGTTNATALSLGTNNTVRVTIDSAGNMLNISNTGLGYGAGSGGTVTQNTSKSTGVTLNKVSGQITMNAAALAANTSVTFLVTNSTVLAADNVIVNLKGGYASYGTYDVKAEGIAPGSFVITLRNISGGSLSEAIILGYSIIRGSTT